eukprot:3086464-Rhodomonas_salina.3
MRPGIQELLEEGEFAVLTYQAAVLVPLFFVPGTRVQLYTGPGTFLEFVETKQTPPKQLDARGTDLLIMTCGFKSAIAESLELNAPHTQ